MAFWDNWFNTKSEQQDLLQAQSGRETVEKLVALGANPNASSTGGMTPMHHAVMNGQADRLKALLDLGGQVDFNSAAIKAAVAADLVPGQPEQSAPAVALDGDIEIRKPLTFKPKG